MKNICKDITIDTNMEWTDENFFYLRSPTFNVSLKRLPHWCSERTNNGFRALQADYLGFIGHDSVAKAECPCFITPCFCL